MMDYSQNQHQRNLDKYIEELMTLTLHFPICVEIDIKGKLYGMDISSQQ